MDKKRREGRTKQQRARAGTLDERTEQQLAQLREMFATFRQENRLRTRIPEFLRDAVMEEVQRGTPEVEVIRACRISRELLERWREVKVGYARRVKAKASKARVFSVIDDKASDIGSGVSGEEESSHLQLRIGGWEISIRQNG